MIKSLALSILMSAPAFNNGDTVLVVKGNFKDCAGIITDVIQSVDDNLYDISLSSCSSRYIKRPYRLDGISESDLKRD